MKLAPFAAALVAAGVVSVAPAGAVPVGSQNACVAVSVPASGPGVPDTSSCRFIGGSSIGVLGFSDVGWDVSYKAKRVASTGQGGCAASYATVRVVVESWGLEPSPPGSQTTFAPAGRVYTLKVYGIGEAQAGGPGDTPSAEEPPDTVVDETNGVPAC